MCCCFCVGSLVQALLDWLTCISSQRRFPVLEMYHPSARATRTGPNPPSAATVEAAGTAGMT